MSKSNYAMLMGALEERYDTGFRAGRARGIEAVIEKLTAQVRDVLPPVNPSQIPPQETPIEALQLSVRSYNTLKREGIHTLGKLCAFTAAELLDLRNFGQGSLAETEKALKTVGLQLKPSGEPGQMLLLSLVESPAASVNEEAADETTQKHVQAGYLLAKNELLTMLSAIRDELKA